tara:strand:+ start:163 stop:582 length:420 start_codon:yes stop_codon:yes gene_type:complete
MTTINDVKRFNLKFFDESDGRLTPVEFHKDVPFRVKRMFYVFGVHNQNDRGKHSHYETRQLLISINGAIDVKCDDGIGGVRTWKLDKPWKALYIPEMIWDEQIYTSSDSVLLVLANTLYDTSDYIEDYEEFRRLKSEDK